MIKQIDLKRIQSEVAFRIALEEVFKYGYVKTSNLVSSEKKKYMGGGLCFEIRGNYKSEKFAIKIDNFYNAQFLFSNRTKPLQKELIPILSRFMKTKPVGYYDVECKNNPIRNYRSVLWDNEYPDETCDKIVNQRVAFGSADADIVNEKIVSDDNEEEFRITKTGLCGGCKKTPFQICGQTNLVQELTR